MGNAKVKAIVIILGLYSSVMIYLLILMMGKG